MDINKNAHDLDFVLERGGTPDTLGTPVAFIETAWRRYTKHSRNKAQEIQGAIEPLAQTYRNSAPFKGAILAGVFTEGALTQLKSLGFTVLYFPYDALKRVFQRFGVDAAFDENTPDKLFERKIKSYESLSSRRKNGLAAALIREHRDEVEGFLKSLALVISRQVERIRVLILHANSYETTSVDEAISYIDSYADPPLSTSIERFEIEVRYTNGDSIFGTFKEKQSAIEFLLIYQPTIPAVE